MGGTASSGGVGSSSNFDTGGVASYGAPSLDSHMPGQPSAPATPGTDFSASGMVEGQASGSIPGQPSAPTAPTLDANTVASVSGNETVQSGVNLSNTTQSTAGQAQVAYEDPTAAAKGQASAKVAGQVDERTPESISNARSDVQGGVTVYEDPQAAARSRAQGVVDEQVDVRPATPSAGGSVSANVTVTSPKPDGSK